MRHLIVHYHIFKNAGSTFDAMLEATFGSRWANHDKTQAAAFITPAELAEYIQAHPHLDALSSHHAVLPLPEMEDVEITPVLFLRHPLDRIRSVYDFERKQGQELGPVSKGAEQASKLTLAEYIRWRLDSTANGVVHNFQTVRLIHHPRFNRFPITDAEFDLAIARLHALPFFGLVEDFDRSVERFSLMLKAKGIEFASAYESRNQSKRESALGGRLERMRDEIGQKLWIELQERNVRDIALYSLAKNIINKEINKTTAILHIGLEKTGTTSIQKILAANIEPLKINGINYPGFLKSENHFDLAIPGLRRDKDNKLLKWRNILPNQIDHFSSELKNKLAEEILPGSTWIFSSEFLSSQVITLDGIKAIYAILAEKFTDFRVVIFVRRTEELFESRYVTAVKAGRYTPLTDDEKNAGRSGLNYADILGLWCEVFGRESVKFEIFKDSANSNSLYEKFFKAAGLADILPILDLGEERYNVGLAPLEVEVLRRANDIWKKTLFRKEQISARRHALVFFKNTNTAPVKNSILNNDEVIRIRAARRKHDELVARYLTPDDAEYFLQAAQPRVCGVREDTPEAVSTLLEVVLKSVQMEAGTEVSEFPQDVNSPLGNVSLELRRCSTELQRLYSMGDLKVASEGRESLGRLIYESRIKDGYFSGNEITKEDSIPLRVFQYCDQLSPPPEVGRLMATWDNSDWFGEHRVFSFESARSLVVDCMGSRGEEAFDRAIHPVTRADLCCYAALFAHGGWYVDAKNIALLPMRGMLDWPARHVFLKRDKKDIIVNTFLGAVAGSSIIEEVLNKAVGNSIESRQGDILNRTGSGVLTEVLMSRRKIGLAESLIVLPVSRIYGIQQKVVNDG